MEKLMQLSKKLDTLFRILQKTATIAMGVALLVLLVLTVVNLAAPDAVIGEDFCSVDLGPVTLELVEELAPDNGTILLYAWLSVLLGVAAAVILCRAFGLIRRILQPMTEGRPFDAGTAQNIRKLSYAALLLGLVQNIGSLLTTAAAVRIYRLTELADLGAVRSVTANFHVELGFVIVFFVLLLISHVFRYGAELQQLSDETL